MIFFLNILDILNHLTKVLGVHWVPLTGWGVENADPGSEDAAHALSLLLYALARSPTTSCTSYVMTAHHNHNLCQGLQGAF